GRQVRAWGPGQPGVRGQGNSTRSDGQGRFLLPNVTAGHCALETDGRSASENGNPFGQFFHSVDLVGGITNVLPYTVWLTAIDRAHAARVTSSVNQEQVITTPNIKGLELHLPPNSVIRDANGSVVTEVSITPVPSGRTPYPMPRGVAF